MIFMRLWPETVNVPAIFGKVLLRCRQVIRRWILHFQVTTGSLPQFPGYKFSMSFPNLLVSRLVVSCEMSMANVSCLAGILLFDNQFVARSLRQVFWLNRLHSKSIL